MADRLGGTGRGRRAALAGLVLLTAAAALGLPKIEIDARFESWFEEEDPVLQEFRALTAAFGTDEVVILFYRNEDLFTEAQLDLNRALTDTLAALPHVRSVQSLTGLRIPRLVLGRLIHAPLLPRTPSDPDRLRRTTAEKASLRDNFLSPDGAATTLFLTLDTADMDARAATLERIREAVAQEPFRSNTYYLAGSVAISTEMYRISSAESARFVGISVAVMLVLLYLFFGSLRSALATVGVSLLTVVLTLGLFGHAGKPINMVTGILPLVLIVVSLSVSVHIVARLDETRPAGPGRGPPVRQRLRPIVTPCLFSSLTTACAFLSFVYTDIRPVRDFGLFAAIGVLLAFGLSFLVLPAVLGDGGRRPERTKAAEVRVRRWKDRLGRLSDAVVRGRFWVAGASLAVLAVSLAGVARTTFETDQMKYLRPSNPVREANLVAREWFEGIYPVEIVVRLPDSLTSRPRHYFELFSALERDLLADPEVDDVHALTTFVRDFFPEPQQVLAFASVAAARTAGEGQDAENGVYRFVSEAGDRVRLSVKTRWMNSEDTLALLDRLGAVLDERLEAGATYAFSGVIPLIVRINRLVTVSQIRSFGISFAVIFGMLALLLRSPLLAVAGMIPNVLPVLTTWGLMGWFGVPMDVATVLIAAISLGIAIDDTIHFLWRYRTERAAGGTDREVLRRTSRGIGRPIVVTTCVLAIGFLTMLCSAYMPVVLLGLFVALTILFALAYDLLLLPALIGFGMMGRG